MCYATAKLPAATFDAVASAVNSSAAYIALAPRIEAFIDCQFVTGAVTDVGGFACSHIQTNMLLLFAARRAHAARRGAAPSVLPRLVSGSSGPRAGCQR